MPDDKLTFSEVAALMTLMAEAQEVRNADLVNRRRLELKKASREKLAAAGLINVRTENRQYYLELSERGWQRCAQELGADVPARAGTGGAALYALLAGIKRCLDQSELSLSTIFGRFEDTVLRPTPVRRPPVDAEQQIRTGYQELTGGSGRWVRLSELRGRLSGISHAEVDEALRALNQAPEVSIVPESDQKLLTEQDRAAAVQIGNQDRHLLAIGPS